MGGGAVGADVEDEGAEGGEPRDEVSRNNESGSGIHVGIVRERLWWRTYIPITVKDIRAL